MAFASAPIAVCTKCGTPIFNAILTNDRCGKRFDGLRCNGVYRETSSQSEWKRCDRCDGSGLRAKKSCDHCHGTGWQYLGNKGIP